MNGYPLLLEIGFFPAVAGMLFSLPLWWIRRINNQTIQCAGLLVLLSALFRGLFVAFTHDDPLMGFLCIAVGSINIFLFKHYTRLLWTLRCPACHHLSMRVHGHRNRTFRLHCLYCGLHSVWRE